MNNHEQKTRKRVSLFKATGGSVAIALPAILGANLTLAIPQTQSGNQISQASPNTSTPTRPRPGIFNEAPYNRQQATPTAPDSQQLPSTSPRTPPSPSEPVIQPPLPESQQPPSATVALKEGKLNIKLINTTNAAINYQVIGDTNQRILEGDSDATLQGITTPVSLTFGRADKGLLRVTTKATSSGLLEVTLDETTNLDEDKTTVVVQPSGEVYIN